jgi:hypothetical protein
LLELVEIEIGIQLGRGQIGTGHMWPPVVPGRHLPQLASG